MVYLPFILKFFSFLQVITDVEVLAERPQEEGEGRDRDGRGSGRGGRADPALQHGLAIWLFGRYKEKAWFLSLGPWTGSMQLLYNKVPDRINV